MQSYERDLNDGETDSDKILSKFSFIKHMPRYGSSFSPEKVAS
jgi:hypothetical protein